MTIASASYLDDDTTLHPDNAAAAIVLVPGESYLLQLRDAKRGIFFPDCWGCFGGAIEARDGSAEAGLRREMREELGLDLAAAELSYFSDFTFDFSFCGVGVIHRTFYEIRLDEGQMAGLRLGEGSALRALPAREALSSLRLVPYDAFALWAHSQRRRLAPAQKER